MPLNVSHRSSPAWCLPACGAPLAAAIAGRYPIAARGCPQNAEILKGCIGQAQIATIRKNCKNDRGRPSRGARVSECVVCSINTEVGMQLGTAPLLERHRIFHSRNDEARAYLQCKEFQLHVNPRRAGSSTRASTGVYLPGMWFGYAARRLRPARSAATTTGSSCRSEGKSRSPPPRATPSAAIRDALLSSRRLRTDFYVVRSSSRCGRLCLSLTRLPWLGSLPPYSASYRALPSTLHPPSISPRGTDAAWHATYGWPLRTSNRPDQCSGARRDGDLRAIHHDSAAAVAPAQLHRRAAAP